MKTHPNLRSVLRAFAVSAFAFMACNTQAQTQVYFENFDVDNTPNWIINPTPSGSNVANIFFDYSSVGIPPAPNSIGGTTRGLKLQAQLDAATAFFPSGITVSPSGFNITDNFEMRFDFWLNYNGPLNGGGSGSTQIGGAGYGTAGDSAEVAGVGVDSVFVGASGDGSGTTADYRVYSPSRATSYLDAALINPADPSSPTVYFAGSRNNSATYYATNFLSQTAPAAQLALFPQQTGSTQPGSAGFKWHDVSLRKIANTITYSINGVLIATVDAREAGTLGGGNILFTHFDINATASTDPNAKFLAFTLFDNVRITNFPNVVGVDATVAAASEQGPTPGTFTITRTAAGAPLTVNYTVSGSASNGVDYVSLPGSVTFLSTETTTNITLTPIDDSIPEETERVVVTINESVEYTGAGSATVTIADNEPSQLVITNIFAQMYEHPNDYATFKITRRGDLTTFVSANLTFTGSAVQGVDYSPESFVATFNPGDVSVTNRILALKDELVEGSETVIVGFEPAGSGEYTIGTPGSATATIIDANLPPETVLFSDDFSADTSANYIIRYGDTNTAATDYVAAFQYDYSGLGLPPAPNSTNSDTLGVYLTVNKNDQVASAAALNLYPAGQTFTGSYALRFDMYLINGGGAAATEYAIFGINHSGTKTNWFRNTAGGVGAGATFDGLFVGVESDGAGLGDYALYSAPTTAGNNPTSLTSRAASTLTGIFKAPPYVVAGVAANSSTNPTPTWAEVELSQVGGFVTLKINQTIIFTRENTTPFASGNIMIGYNDAYDSTGPSGAAVIFDNIRVVRLTEFKITTVQSIGNNIQIDFTYEAGKAESLKVKSAGEVTQPFLDTAATITEVTPGSYRAIVAKNGSMRFYRIGL